MNASKRKTGKKVLTIKKDERLPVLCGILSQNSLSGIPVVDGKNKLVGYVSEKDVILALYKKKDFLKKKVSDIMTKKVAYVTSDTPIYDIAKIFSSKPYKSLPVIDSNKKVQGVVARKDIMNKMIGNYY